MTSASSPDFLQPVAASMGVRRLTRRPLLIGMGLALIVAAGGVYTFWHRGPRPVQAAQAPADVSKAGPATVPSSLMKNVPQNGPIAASNPGTGIAPSGSPTGGAAAGTSAHATPGVPEGSALGPADQLWQDYQRHTTEVQDEHFDAERQALQASSSIGTHLNDSASVPPTAQSAAAEVGSGFHDGATGLRNLAALVASDKGSFNAANGQSAKQAWLDSQPNADDYLHHARAAAASPFEVKAGTVIPALMVGGVNSDSPGELVAQVSENVYDTATGRYLLIPQGAKLVGTYDNQVTFGQSRVLVGWQRIIYPDASSLDLSRMPGADISGYAGFHDKVNNHLFKVFSEAFMLSVFSAGIQLGQPQATNGQNYNSTQIVSAAIAQQMGELGMEIVRRNMDVAPTLEVRPGYPFNVMVTKDMIITPWNTPAVRR